MLVLLGAGLSLALGTAATLALLAIQHTGREVGAASIAADVITAGFGFAVVARRVTKLQALMIASIYFPTIIALMFFEALYFDAKFYGNTF
jgi:hypothetical protein